MAPEVALVTRGVELDVLAHTQPGFQRTNFVEIIQNSAWPE